MQYLEMMRASFVLLTLGLFFLSLTYCIFPLQSDDLFMYLAMAKKYFELGHFPTEDIFLVHPLPWHMEHQWLSYFFFYGLYQSGGYLLISIAKVILLLASMALPFVCLRPSRLSCLSLAAGAVAVLLTCLAANFRFFERSELLTNFFAVLVTVICLLEIQKPTRWKWFLPSIFVLWVNFHPGFPLGWALIASAVAALVLQKSFRPARDLFLCLFFCLLACLINPLGVEGVLYPFQFSAQYAPFLKHYYFEWYSPFHEALRTSPHLPYLLLIEIYTFLLLLTSSILGQKKLWYQWFVFLLASYFLLTGVRFAPLSCFLLLTVCVSLPTPPLKTSFQIGLNTALAVLCLAIAIKNLAFGYESISGSREVRFGIDTRVVPVAAVEWMKEHHVPGPVYNSHMFGAYLAWAWDGKYVYDGSITNPDYFLNEYLPFVRSREDFDRQAAKYQIQSVLLDRFVDARPAIDILSHHPDWKLVYQDDGSLIFTRQFARQH